MIRTDLGGAAIEYARRGWRVIPLHHLRQVGERPICGCFKRETCRTPGKHPMIKNWRETASSDPALVAQWWRVWPRANIGLLMGGGARLVTIDIDGSTGRSSWEAFQNTFEPVPETLRQTTGRAEGGEHFLFTVDTDFDLDKIRNRARIAPGVDVRAEGGLIVAAPSVHPTGVVYAWRNFAVPVAPLPPWLLTIIVSNRARQMTKGPSAERPTEAQLRADGWPLDRRLQMARSALSDAEPAISGRGGHKACLKAAILLVRGFCLSSDDAFDLLWHVYNPMCIPPWSVNELMHKIESAEFAVSNDSYPWRFRIPAPDLSPAGRTVQAIYDACARELGSVEDLWNASPDDPVEKSRSQ
jgi:hypothetical protein